jgi:PAS domain S-box-containing protein
VILTSPNSGRPRRRGAGARAGARRQPAPEACHGADSANEDRGDFQTGEDDRDHRVVDVNDAFCRLTGRSREEVLGESLASLRSDEHPAEFYEAAEETLRTTGEWKGEVFLTRADGTAFPAWLALTVVRDEEGAGASIVGVFTDLTDITKAHDQLIG